MSKIGVGVGDDFPVDDGSNPNTNNSNNPGSEPPRDDRAEFEEWKRRRDAYRGQREQWRAQHDEWQRRKAEWKEQWRESRRAWRDQQRETYDGGFAYPQMGRRQRGGGWFFGGHGLMRLLGLFLVVALVVFAISHIGYILAGLAAVAVLFVAYHHFGHDPLDFGQFDRGGRDYARPVNNPPPAPTQAVDKPAGTDNTGPQA